MLLHSILILPAVLAGTTVNYFKNPSCDVDGLGQFSDSVSNTDTACHISPYNVTKAIYVDTIDDDCAIITYSDYKCTPEKARHKFAEREICFFSSAGGLLRSWKNVCGGDLAAASSSFATFRATASHITTSSASFSLTTVTTTSVWQSWNGTANANYSATVTQTKSTPIQATGKSGAARGSIANVIAGIALMTLGMVVTLFH